MAPILKNDRNLSKFPQCVADDIKRQVHELSTSVYQIRGHIKGKTLLPFPQQGAARIEAEEARVRASSGDDCDMTLKNNIEGKKIFPSFYVSNISTLTCLIKWHARLFI